MRRWIGIVALLALVAAVFFVLRSPSRSGLEATDATAGTTSSTGAASTDTTTAPSSAPSSLAGEDDATDTTEAPTEETTTDTADPVEPEAEFAMTEVQFGENGFVAIRNVGSAAGNLGGYALCSELQYFQIPEVELAPLEIVWVAFGDGATLGDGAGIAKEVVAVNGQLGIPTAASGEMGLYRGSNFADPALLATYVAWGDAQQPRAQVAVEAGIWEDGAVLSVPSDAFGIQSVAGGRPAAGLADWTAGVGG